MKASPPQLFDLRSHAPGERLLVAAISFPRCRPVHPQMQLGWYDVEIRTDADTMVSHVHNLHCFLSDFPTRGPTKFEAAYALSPAPTTTPRTPPPMTRLDKAEAMGSPLSSLGSSDDEANPDVISLSSGSEGDASPKRQPPRIIPKRPSSGRTPSEKPYILLSPLHTSRPRRESSKRSASPEPLPPQKRRRRYNTEVSENRTLSAVSHEVRLVELQLNARLTLASVPPISAILQPYDTG